MKFVFRLGGGDESESACLQRAGEALLRRPDHTLRAISWGAWRGRLALKQGEKPSAFEAANGNRLLVAGTPVLAGDLHIALAHAAAASAAEAPAHLSVLDGAFAALHFDAASSNFTIVTDRLGLAPVYRAHAKGVCAFASRADAASAALGADDASPDPKGWAAFLRLGYAIEEATLAQGVTRLPAGAVCRIGIDGVVQTTSHWRFPQEADASDRLLASRVGDLADAVEAEAEAYRDAYGEAVLLLSGGFDSRFIAAALHRRKIEAHALAVAHPERGNADGRLARALAHELRLPVEVRRMGARTSFVSYLDDTEISNPSLGLFIAQVAALIRDERPRAVWDGLALGWSMSGFYDPAAHVEAFFRRVEAQPRDDRMAHALWHAAHTVFAPSFRTMLEEAWAASREAAIAAYPPSPEGLQHFLVNNRLRRRVAMHTLQALTEDTEVFTPGLGRAYLENILRIPLAQRLANAPYRTLYRERYREAARVPVISGTDIYRLREGFDARAAYEEMRASVLGHWRVQRWAARFAGAGTPTSPLQNWAASVDVEALCDDPHLDADAVRASFNGDADGPAARRGLELLLYWERFRTLFGAAKTV